MTAPALTLLDDVRWRGRAVPGGRAHTLLAALALEPSRGVGDARLVDEVWGEDDPPANPTKALQVLVSRTRTQTGPEVVVRNGQGYALGLGADDVDATRLTSLGARARAALAAGDLTEARDAARAATELAVSDPGTPDGDPLSRLHRRALADQDGAREVLGRVLSALGEHEEALPLLEAGLARRPGDEALLEALLRSEAAVRGAAIALDRYERHRTGLVESLGTDPGPRLQRLHEQLLALDRPVREGLRHDASRLIGRDLDVAALGQVIRSSRVTSIVGAGGLGKTRLAHVLGRRAEQPVVHFVELAGVTSPEGVAIEVGSSLGVRESVTSRRLYEAAHSADLHARIVERIGTVPTLLILDNCEHVVDAVADLVAVLVARAPELRVLTTTRAPLGLAAERVYALPQLDREDGVELFRERATAARPGVRLDDSRVHALVDRLDGLPLALELAAAKVRVMSVEEIERRLENRFALLRGGSRDAPERHQTLLAVIDWSWNLLSEDERVALRRLSVFRDGFALDGASAVVGHDDTLGLLTRLVDQSLVTVHEGETLRYRLLETVREFGRMQLVDAGDDGTATALLRGWATGLAERHADRLLSREQVDAMRAVRVEEGNLTDVLRQALADDDPATVLCVMNLLAIFWTVSGDHLKVVNVAAAVEQVLSREPVRPDDEDRMRGVLSVIVVNNLIFGGAVSATAVDRLRELGPGDGVSSVTARTKVILAVAEVSSFAEVGGLQELRDDPDPRVAMLALQWISGAKENAGDLDGAFEAARASLALCDDEEGPWQRAMLTSQLAGLAAQVGDVAGARAYVEQALGPMEELGAVEDATQLRAMLAVCDMRVGRLDAAQALLDRVSAEDRSESIFGSRMIVLCGHAELALLRGEVDDGLARYRDAVAVLSGRATVPGVDIEVGLEPWVIWPQAAAVAAHARHDHDRAPWLRDDLHAKALRGLSESGGFFDFPVSGAVALALGLWELTSSGRDEATLERAVRLLAVADRFAYNRVLPSLDWEPAVAAAERARPGLLAAVTPEYAARPVDDLRPVLGKLVVALP